MSEPIKENISENTEGRKRGRPKTWHREFNDSLGNLKPHGCMRTQINQAYGLALQRMFSQSSEQEQRDLCGCTEAEILAGKAKPLRWHTAGNELGRYLELIGDNEENRAAVFATTLDARRRGLRWGDIGKHFRKARLGSRSGNAMSLTQHLARAFDDYCSRFPATTKDARLQAIYNLLDVVEDDGE